MSLSPDRRLSSKPHRETGEVAEGVIRLVRAIGRRVAGGDPWELEHLAALQGAVDQALEDAIHGLRESGYSDGQIGKELGITRQAVRQRWPHRVQRAGAARVWR